MKLSYCVLNVALARRAGGCVDHDALRGMRCILDDEAATLVLRPWSAHQTKVSGQHPFAAVQTRIGYDPDGSAPLEGCHRLHVSGERQQVEGHEPLDVHPAGSDQRAGIPKKASSPQLT